MIVYIVVGAAVGLLLIIAVITIIICLCCCCCRSRHKAKHRSDARPGSQRAQSGGRDGAQHPGSRQFV
jgi:hypothetical protein